MTTPFWYNAALALLKPIYKWRIKKRADNIEQFHQECLERFGPFQSPKNLNAIWFHVVSVGETNAAQPLIEHYLKLGYAVLVTNTTKTGQARAKSLFAKAPYVDLFQAVYLPADQKKLVSAFFKKYQPKMLVLVETELWPNLINEAKINKIPTFLVNARLSEKSAKGYAKVPSITQPMLSGLTQLLAQDEASLNRFRALGAATAHSQTVGSIKFDIHAPEEMLLKAQQIHQDWDLQARQIITIASTHHPEEKNLLSKFKDYLNDHPAVLLIIVPRHPERFDEVAQAIQSHELKMHRRSLGEIIEADTQVYLADSMGEMWIWYALSQASFVGGSLNEPGGGHNILEPISLNVPTVIGPNYFNFQTIVDEFVEEKGILIGQTTEEVVNHLIQCLSQDETILAVQNQAQKIMQRNTGSLQKHIHVLNQYL